MSSLILLVRKEAFEGDMRGWGERGNFYNIPTGVTFPRMMRF